jgi:hypothetical protein
VASLRDSNQIPAPTEGSKYDPSAAVVVYGTPGSPGYVSPSGSTAKTLILVAIILALIIALIYVFLVGLSFLFVCAGFAGCGGIPFWSILFIAFGALAFVWLVLIWLLCYKPTKAGQYEQARTPTLVFMILSFITLNFLTGILLLIAYLKLGDAARESQMPPTGGYYPGMPTAAAPAYAAPPQPPATGTASSPATTAGPGSVPICPKCGKPGTFVAQYNRYYCYTDSAYL